MHTNSVQNLRNTLIQAVDGAGFSISGPTDVRAAENGEPAWVCNARAAIASVDIPANKGEIQNIMGPIEFRDFYLSAEFSVHQVKSRIEQINVGIAFAKLLEILHENPAADVLLFAAEITQEYDDNGYYSCTRVDTFELLDANGEGLSEFTVNGTRYRGDDYTGEEDLDLWDDDYEGLLMESPYYFEDLADQGVFRLEREAMASFMSAKFDLDDLLKAVTKH